MKKLDLDHLRKFRDTLELPISDDQIDQAPYFHPGENSPEIQYLKERRRQLGGEVPSRTYPKTSLTPPPDKVFAEFIEGGKANLQISTTMAFVRLLRNLLRDKAFGKHIVPIIPDEGRTFGMDALFREIGIYAALGQQYDPVDANHFLYYRESQTGQILEEGITEAGSMASFLAAGSAYANHNTMMIPFYTFYSMFGFQRTCDQIWQAGDQRTRGFLMGATAGRTTLNGEGLQHEDGHSMLFANAVPNLRAYDPAYAYDTAVIIKDGLQRMLDHDEDVLYYIALYNENYIMPSMPEGAEEGILKGIYRHPDRVPLPKKPKAHAQLFGSGTILNSVLEAQQILVETYNIAAPVWNVTSYQQLYRDGRAVRRHNRMNPNQEPKLPYLLETLKKAQAKGPIVAASDWVSELPETLASLVPKNPITALGTNGYGRSDTREALRRHFEVDAHSIVIAVLSSLSQQGKVEASEVRKAIADLNWDPNKIDPAIA